VPAPSEPEHLTSITALIIAEPTDSTVSARRRCLHHHKLEDVFPGMALEVTSSHVIEIHVPERNAPCELEDMRANIWRGYDDPTPWYQAPPAD
jgi:hypothetical protein